MAPPGAYPMKKLALFNLTSRTISEAWLQHIQAEGDKDNDDDTIIEVIAAGPGFSRLDMARHSHQHFLSPDSPFASRCLLAADDKAIETRTVIIINLVLQFLERDLGEGVQYREEDVIEGHMRIYPNSCFAFAVIFDTDTQGIDKYDGAARDAPEEILPRIDTPSVDGDNSGWKTRVSSAT
ncbi:hypothetical protein CBS101457_002981 [Exobasidium rhododendri]|nr:hypothetical protein CBS101457_002981 [Exobasidium rhododendri]